LAFVLVAIGLIVGELAPPSPSEGARDARLFVLFMAIIAGGVFGGAVCGLVATALGCAAALWLGKLGPPHHGLPPAAAALLAAEGVFVALIGLSLDRARQRVRRSDADVRKLQREILEIGDEQRQRIGHDLHDGLGQQLTGISLLTESLAQKAASGAAPTLDEVERITRLASEAVQQARELARNLSPLTLEHDGFVAAIEELAETAAGLLGIQCEWDNAAGDPPLDPKRALHLYRIVQEAVSNSVKHGKAKRVRISASLAGRELVLVVSDDGSGLSHKTISNPGLGLRIMEYRARMVGAELTAERAGPDGGTVVRCTCRIDEMPVHKNEPERGH
jgi:signal transduction histidine kinase